MRRQREQLQRNLRNKFRPQRGPGGRLKERSSALLDVRLDYGSIVPQAPRFSTGFVTDPCGPACVELSDDEVIAAALRIVAARVVRSNSLSSTRALREYLVLRFAGLEHEVFSCMFLDNQYQLVAFEDLFRGTLNGASVHPREVAKRALVHNAGAVVFCHNHPACRVAEPSKADEAITCRLVDALSLFDIRVLDHLVVAGTTLCSFRERGLLGGEEDLVAW